MEKPLKIMLGISVLLVIGFGLVLWNDSIQFQANIASIIKNLETDDPERIRLSWYSVVFFRAVLFILPAFLLAAAALLMHFMQNRRYSPRK